MKSRISRRDFLARTGVGASGLLLLGADSKKEFDTVIRRGQVFDGLGGPPVEADVAITGERIARIGEVAADQGRTVIDAKDLAVCPGFIDVHNHTDVHLLVEPRAPSMVHQGVTTLIGGNCGFSTFPVAEALVEESREDLKAVFGLELDWRDMQGFLSKLMERGVALHYATLLGQGAVRAAVVGLTARPPKAAELAAMRRMVREHMQLGCVGLSTGLAYTPGSFAKTDELKALCREVAPFSGVYATHMRSEGDRLLDSIGEAVEIAMSAGTRLQISHLKAAYARNWHKLPAALGKIERARKRGLDVACDRYPYAASSTGLSSYFPQWAKVGTTEDFLRRLGDKTLDARLRAHLAERERKLGSWDKVLISYVAKDENQGLVGKTVARNAKEAGKAPYEFIRDLLVAEKSRVGMISFIMQEENLHKVLAHPLVGIGSDGAAISPEGVLGKGKPHPRFYGTFPRALRKYVREEKLVPFAEMIRKMTSAPARMFGLTDRGVLREGAAADLVVLDPERVADRATWTDPHQFPEGIEHVLVAGTSVIARGEHTGSLPGKILRHSQKT